MSAAEDFGRVPCPGWRDTPSPQREACLCGADVTRAPRESTAAAVCRHNRAPAHRRWWERVKGEWQ